jgi:hypothetical protein
MVSGGQVEGPEVGGATDSEAAAGGGEYDVGKKKDDERASLGGGRRATHRARMATHCCFNLYIEKKLVERAQSSLTPTRSSRKWVDKSKTNPTTPPRHHRLLSVSPLLSSPATASDHPPPADASIPSFAFRVPTQTP